MKSIGLVWQSAKPWSYPRMAPPAMVKVRNSSNQRSSWYRRGKTRRPLRVYWLHSPPERPPKPAPPPPVKPPAPVVEDRAPLPLPLQVVAVPAPPQLVESVKQGPPMNCPFRAMGACFMLVIMAAFIGGLVGRSFAPQHPRSLGVLAMDPEDDAMDASFFLPDAGQLLGALPIIEGPVSSEQLTPPCGPLQTAYRGACWERVDVHGGDEKTIRYQCEHTNGYIVSLDDCVKHHRVYLPVMKRKPLPRATDPGANEK